MRKLQKNPSCVSGSVLVRVLHYRWGTALVVGALSTGCLSSGEASFAWTSDDEAAESSTLSADEIGSAAPELAAGEGQGSSASSARVSEAAASAAVRATSGALAAGELINVSASGEGVSAPRNPSMLGYNMDYPGDWTNVPPFIDQMKNARAFNGRCGSESQCDPAAHLDLDAAGWVKSLRYKDDPARSYGAVDAVINTSTSRTGLGQTFVVTWEGTGLVAIHADTGVAAEGREGRLTFRLAAGNTVVSLKDIDATDYVRNIRIFRADHEPLLEQGEVFDPEMLAFLAPFGSLRFMDWMQSNSHGKCSGGTAAGEACYAVTEETCGGGGTCIMPGAWDQRPTGDQPSAVSWGQYLDNARPELGTKVGGYSVETMVALANRAGVDPHFNMPAHYDDEYVRAFAEYVKAHLGPGLTASVEYSNEVWNWGFPQAQYASTRGRELWPEEGSAWVQYAAGRTSNMCAIWKDVFAGDEERVRCLISPQTGWKEMAETVLECPDWVESNPGSGPCYEHVDAINITGYFSGCLPSNEGVVQSWLAEGRVQAVDRAFEQLEHGGLISGCGDTLDETVAAYSYFRDLADQRGLDIYVYESGTHFDYYGDQSVEQLLVDVSRDERMYDVYQRNFEGFRAAGGSVFNVWGWVAPNDAWANSESLADREHPKYRAISDFAKSGS